MMIKYDKYRGQMLHHFAQLFGDDSEPFMKKLQFAFKQYFMGRDFVAIFSTAQIWAKS